jgi:hypothetical protein
MEIIARTLQASQAACGHDPPPFQSGGLATALQSAAHEIGATFLHALKFARNSRDTPAFVTRGAPATRLHKARA